MLGFRILGFRVLGVLGFRVLGVSGSCVRDSGQGPAFCGLGCWGFRFWVSGSGLGFKMS